MDFFNQTKKWNQIDFRLRRLPNRFAQAECAES